MHSIDRQCPAGWLGIALCHIPLRPARRSGGRLLVRREVPGSAAPKPGQRQYNQALGALRALAEKANADLKMRFQALRRVGLNPWRIGVIARACLAVFQHEHGRIA